MAEITTDELPESLQTLFIEVERTKTPLTIIHQGKPLVIVYPAITETKRPSSGVMKGTGKILGDIVAPAAEPIRTSSNRLASLGQDRGKFVVPEDFNEPLPEEITEKLNSVYSQNSSDLDENIAKMQFSSLRCEEW
ncbi:hypothetical protein ACP6PL_22840 [Dapis sp. BLCC M126]|uniref:hypothetical protein n=1 Tax=Dapis sp. BLCC M126 TaxID=3400189 RepID=UPI003CEB6DA2